MKPRQPAGYTRRLSDGAWTKTVTFGDPRWPHSKGATETLVRTGWPFNDRENRWVTCFNCECDGPCIRVDVENPEPEAMRLWNTRNDQAQARRANQ